MITGRRLVAVGLTTAALLAGGDAVWIPAKAALAQELLARAWRQTGPGRTVPPWPWADTWPVARLRWPAGGVEQVVLAGAAGATLAFGPGHLDGSALPGELGNCVLAGHRDTHFEFLARLVVGDLLDLEDTARVTYRYRVTTARVVTAGDPRLAAPTTTATLTLVTCWPFVDPVPGGPWRYVVEAVLESGQVGDGGMLTGGGVGLP